MGAGTLGGRSSVGVGLGVDVTVGVAVGVAVGMAVGVAVWVWGGANGESGDPTRVGSRGDCGSIAVMLCDSAESALTPRLARNVAPKIARASKASIMDCRLYF